MKAALRGCGAHLQVAGLSRYGLCIGGGQMSGVPAFGKPVRIPSSDTQATTFTGGGRVIK